MLAPAAIMTGPDWEMWLAARRFEAAEAARMAQYTRNWDYYNGQHKDMLYTRPGQANDNVTINLARLIVDKGASFLFGKDLTFDLQGEDEQSAEEELLALIWRRNRKMTFLMKVGITGGIYGTAFIKIVADGHGENIPRLIVLDPEYVSVLANDEDAEHALAYVIEWLAQDVRGRGVHKREVMRVNERGTWDIEYHVNRGKGAGGTGGVWVSDPDREDVAWEFSWPPIIHCQNLPVTSSLYGLSDLEDLNEQDDINYVASKINRILRYHMHPKTFASGIGPNQDIAMGEDDVAILPNLDARVWNLEMESDLGSGMGFMDRLISWFFASARIPRIDPATINVGALSGFALKVLYGPLLEKTGTKRRLYGDMLEDLNARLLELGGYDAEQVVANHWADPLPADQAAEDSRDQFEMDAGIVSKETVQRRRGIDPETEAERMATEQAATGNLGELMLRTWQNQQGTVPGARIEPGTPGGQPVG